MFRNEGLKYPSYVEHFFFVRAITRGKKLKNLRKKLIAYRLNPYGLMSKYADLKENKYKNAYGK